jgi:hypothetical protein
VRWDDPKSDPIGDLKAWAEAYRESPASLPTDLVIDQTGKLLIHRPLLLAMVRRYGVAGTREAANNAARAYGFARCQIFCYQRLETN